MKIPSHPNTTFDEDSFSNLLARSISLTEEEKERVLKAIPRLSQQQINELFNIFEEEQLKFAELETEFASDVEKLKREREDQSERIQFEIKDFLNPHNQYLIRELAKHPTAMTELAPRKFEILVAELMKDLGWTVELTPQTRDGGRDLILTTDFKGIKLMSIVECKQWRYKKVDVNVVKQMLYNVREQDKANKGIIATTALFSPDAIKLGNKYNWLLDLRDYHGLREMLLSFGKHTERPEMCAWRPTKY